LLLGWWVLTLITLVGVEVAVLPIWTLDAVDDGTDSDSFLIFSAEYFRKWWRLIGRVEAGRCDK